MKITTSIAVYCVHQNKPLVLTDLKGDLPAWSLPDSDCQSLHLVEDGLYNITGIGKNWFPPIRQAGTFEFFLNEKHVIIVYSVYFPDMFLIRDCSYKWTSISELDKDALTSGIIRYVYGAKDV